MNNVEMLMLAIAAITMFITLGQLIIAFSQLDTSHKMEKARSKRPMFMWLLILAQGAVGATGIIYFDYYVIEPTKTDVFGFGVSIFSAASAYALAMSNLLIMRAAAVARVADQRLIELALKVERLERMVADEIPSFQ